MTERAFICGLPVDLIKRSELPQLLRHWFEYPPKSRQIVTLNVNMLMLAQKNALLQRAIREADLVSPDGYGIVHALRRRDYQIDRITGLDLAHGFLKAASREGYSVSIYGGSAKVCERLTVRLPRLFPGLSIQAAYDGYGLQCSSQKVIEELRAAPPQVLLVGLGTPAQELFLKNNLPFLPDTVGIGVGGALEILAGLQNQAPQLMQDHGLEWLFRMIQEPRRVNRLPDLVRFWWQFLR